MYCGSIGAVYPEGDLPQVHRALFASAGDVRGRKERGTISRRWVPAVLTMHEIEHPQAVCNQRKRRIAANNGYPTSRRSSLTPFNLNMLDWRKSPESRHLGKAPL